MIARFTLFQWRFYVELDLMWWGLSFDHDEDGGNLWLGPLWVIWSTPEPPYVRYLRSSLNSIAVFGIEG